MPSLVRSLISLALGVLVLPALPASGAAVPSTEICGDYFGVRRCVVVTRPAPKTPRTDKGMQATADRTAIPFSSSVTVTAGKSPGGIGFTKGEVVRLYEFWQGKPTELTSVKFADRNGSVTFSREYLSLAGVDKDGYRTLCARGERSNRMACVKVWVGSGTGSDSDAATATTTPKSASNVKAPSRASTTRGMKSTGSGRTAGLATSVKVTHGPASGGKGFTKGEKVIRYDYYNGQATEIGSSVAGSTGKVTWSWTNDGTARGTHELCSYGVTSKKMACYTVEADGAVTTVAPQTTAAPVVTTPATTPPTAAPTTTTTTTTTTTVPRSTTTLPPYGPPVAG
jgi:hypothetical protein